MSGRRINKGKPGVRRMDDAVSYLRNMDVKRWIKRASERTECESTVKEATARIEGP